MKKSIFMGYILVYLRLRITQKILIGLKKFIINENEPSANIPTEIFSNIEESKFLIPKSFNV